MVEKIKEMSIEFENKDNKRVFDESIELKDNAMLKHRPELFYEWDFEKNDELGLDVYKVTRSGSKKVWWICPKCKSSHDASMNSRVRNNGSSCRFCAGRDVNHTNSLARLRPDVAKEWHPALNGKKTPHDFTVGSHEKIWWLCFECKSNYDMTIKNRTLNKSKCSFCGKKKANHTNSLAVLNPDLASQWHPTKNGGLSPENVTHKSGKPVWWFDERCGHEWEKTVRENGVDKGCPYCATSNARLLIGFNDMWTTNPELASQLLNPEDGYKYMQGSSEKVDWKCQDCGNVNKNKIIYDVARNGISCISCSDGRSYPEKFMYNLLLDLNVSFKTEEIFDWLVGKRYDFYLPECNTIVEMHGSQHYSESNGTFHASKTLEETKINDKLKHEIAIQNGIRNYIVINASESSVEYISNSIKESELLDLLNINFQDIDWDKYNKKSLPSMVKLTAELWDEGFYMKEIADKLKVSLTTVNRYLQKAIDAEMTEYNWDRSRNAPNVTLRKKIVQLTMEGNLVKEWSSVGEAGEYFGAKTGDSISRSLTGKYKTCYGFIWLYIDEYNSNKRNEIVLNRQLKLGRNVVQLDLEGNFIKVWEVIADASEELTGSRKRNKISECCRGDQKSSLGYKWMYLEDYEKEFGKIVSTE